MPTQPAILGTMRLGNFRLGYAPAALTLVRRSQVRILIGGVDARSRVRVGSLTIRDVLNDAPNTCSLTVDTTAPVVSQDLRVSVNSDDPVLLFNGELQTVDLSYEGKPAQHAWRCTAIDDTARLNRIIPFGVWTNVSATTVAQELIATFAPGFTSTHVEAGLPAISIILDGTEGMSGAFRQIAKAIGGYFYVEDLDLHLFQAEVTELPDDLDHTPGRFLDDPPITVSYDRSQIRTRVYGKGHGVGMLSDVLLVETILPLADAVMYNPLGGQVISESQILSYTGIQIGSGGAMVGPGSFPSSALMAALASGSGVESGDHNYAVAFVTAAGESLPGPLATITVGLVAPPTSAPSFGAPVAGAFANVNVGDHDYVVTNVTSAGETTPGPISSQVMIVAGIAAPTSIGTASYQGGGSGTPGLRSYQYTFRRTSDGAETLPSPASNTFTTNPEGSLDAVNLTGVDTPPAGCTRRWYCTAVGGGTWLLIPSGSAYDNGTHTAGFFVHSPASDSALGSAAPSFNQTALAQVPLSGIPIGPTLTTSRKLYRRFNGTGTFKLVTTIANNTDTAYSDTTANASLGADAPSSNTAVANQVALSSVPIGDASVTQRKIYRTAIGSAQLKLQQTIANNTATTGAQDATADASLGANVPTSDTSGLTQPNGQVTAGSTSLIVAGPGAFSSTGGWAIIGNGQQVIRYTGITGGSLTGIPASGPGAITASIGYNSTITAAPALTGVTGLTLALAKGAMVHIWVERNDLAAQAGLIALDAAQGRVSDGVIAHRIQDERRGEASLIAMCDAELALFSQPIATVTYATRDTKTKSGKTITVNLTSPPISAELTIQDVTIDQIDIAVGLSPRFKVTASSVRFSLEDLLRKMAA